MILKRQNVSRGGAKSTLSYNMKLADLNPIEYVDACTLAEWLMVLKNQRRIIEFSHVPQETFTKSLSIKGKNKRMGVRKGVPDYIIIMCDKIVFVELKRRKGNCATPEQRQWIDGINLSGGHAAVCCGFDEAKSYIESLLPKRTLIRIQNKLPNNAIVRGQSSLI